MFVSSQPPLHSATGIIEEVDVPGRAVRVLVDGASRLFDVAADGEIQLYGEPVKLRLLQPRDVVQVLFTRWEDRSVAQAIRANWWLARNGDDAQADGLKGLPRGA